ncbi:DciA family protein [Micrococcus porci]|uniref:DUF721 domain-containing protein n=1 Tax=Micrococcus TaxID=1269 RepID=UPI001CCDD6A3|nr:DciA family protein [Micrococcus porci]MCG7422066.1 DciA family protein [Micrococcus sp. ACRRV]UBH24969.1 DciA family protein [Micrococcus porci]
MRERSPEPDALAELPPDRPDLALVQLRRVRDAARQRGEAPLNRRGTAAGLAQSMAGSEAAAAAGGAVARSGHRRPGAPADRDPAVVSSVFGRLIRDRGWSTPVAVGSVLTRWADLVGPEIALHCRPESFEDSVVRVRTSSTAWATQLRLMSPMLLSRFDEALGPGVVTRIDVAGPAAPSWRHGPRTVRGGRGPRDTYG